MASTKLADMFQHYKRSVARVVAQVQTTAIPPIQAGAVPPTDLITTTFEAQAFFITETVLMTPSDVVVVPPPLLEGRYRYPYEGTVLGADNFPVRPVTMSRIMVEVINIDNEESISSTSIIPASPLLVDGPSASLIVLNPTSLSRCAFRPPRPFGFANSYKTAAGEKVAILGYPIADVQGVSVGTMMNNHAYDNTGTILPELILVDCPTGVVGGLGPAPSLGAHGMPIVNSQGLVVGMQIRGPPSGFVAGISSDFLSLMLSAISCDNYQDKFRSCNKISCELAPYWNGCNPNDFNQHLAVLGGSGYYYLKGYLGLSYVNLTATDVVTAIPLTIGTILNNYNPLTQGIVVTTSVNPAIAVDDQLAAISIQNNRVILGNLNRPPSIATWTSVAGRAAQIYLRSQLASFTPTPTVNTTTIAYPATLDYAYGFSTGYVPPLGQTVSI